MRDISSNSSFYSLLVDITEIAGYTGNIQLFIIICLYGKRWIHLLVTLMSSTGARYQLEEEKEKRQEGLQGNSPRLGYYESFDYYYCYC